MRRFNELRIALMLLTRLPAGRIDGKAPELKDTQWAFPLIGLPIGLIAGLIATAALAIGASPATAGLLGITALGLVTGGLHHDGLADYADGMGGGRDRDHVMEIMRDSRIGSYGVLALGLALALMGTSIASYASALLPAFVFTAIASRLIMLGVLVLVPPARKDGMGHMAGRQPLQVLLPGALLCLAVLPLTGWAAVWALVPMIATAWALSHIAKRRIGGQTGDVLGAVQLASETTGWIMLSALL